MKIGKVLVVPLVLIVVMVFVLAGKGFATEEDNWRFSIEPYLLALSIDGDTSIGRATGVDVDVDFSDILEKLEAAFMINASAYHKSGWGVIIDYGFMILGADTSGPKDGVIDAEVRQGILEAFIAKQLPLQQGHWELYTGIRWWDNDIDVTVQSAIGPGSINPQIKEGWVDPVIGAKLQIPLLEKFELVFRGDVGGFGVSSDFTAHIATGFHYRFTDMISLDVLYKALWVDYETGTAGSPGYFSYTTVTHGPILGVIFEF
jgi:hypothetical protein